MQISEKCTRYTIAAFCLTIVILHAFFPALKIDNISFLFILLAASSLLFPLIANFLKQTKRIKGGPFELELETSLNDLLAKTEAAEKAIDDKNIQQINSPGLSKDVQNKILETASDPRATLLIISIEIEEKLREIATKHKLTPKLSAQQIVHQLVENEIVGPDEVVFTFMKFWEIRNMLVHGQSYILSKEALFEMVDLGIRLLRMLQYWA